MSKNKKGSGPSWFVVILMLSVFWPVGLFFLWQKLQGMEAPPVGKQKGRGMRTGGIAVILGALFLRATGGISFLWTLFWMLGGAALVGFDAQQKKLEKRRQRYLAVVGAQRTASIMAIASTLGVDYNTACDDLQRLIDDKAFPEGAYLDLGQGLFVAHSQYASSTARRAAEKQPPKTAERQPAAEAPIEEENEYVRWLTQIRAANEAIKDEKLSEQIEEIEQYTANIFECVVERPEKKTEIHTFMNYYLPTTLKLLNAYARLERQNVAGGSIEESKRNIESMVDQLVWAFRRQNDQMFAKDALDISSDIKVMETMLARDGLSDGGLPRNPFAAAVQRQ
ncbi:MAG: 5-bromo-4-chloroindolyl phosphate hydrolysis family protein [Eubacteriales bacterium]|nr:5-bromo-4-chloroindolyl phosphate hydrolysis family protein [Eubacteriales bacterium]